MQVLGGIHPGWGIAVVRIMAGLILVVAGWTKIAPGLAGFAGFLTQLGFPAPGLLAPFIAFLELIGGLLVLVGVGVRWVGLLFLIEFLVTAFVVKLPRQGWDASRIDLMMLAAALLFILAGAGKASVDEVLARRQSEPSRVAVRT